MMLNRSVLLASAMCAIACTQALAAGTEYLDRENQFKVTIPDGWTKIAPEASARLDAVLRSPRYDVTRGSCALAADPFPPTRDMTQKQIDEQMGPSINDAFWQGALSGLGPNAVTVDESGKETRNGRQVYTVTVRIAGQRDGVDAQAKMKATLQIAPDQIAMATCASWLDQAPVEEPDMAIVLASFEALGAQVVARGPMPPSATLLLFAGPRFDGNRRELTQDVPNLFQAGWSIPTASFALQGYGLWEVCDGMNYAGNCRVLAGAAAAAVGNTYRPLRIGSARRITAPPHDARTAIGVLSSGVRAQAAENLRYLAKGRR